MRTLQTRKPRTGAEALVEAIEQAGTEVLFGYPGASVVDIFDHLPDARFKFVLARHEQGAMHAADGYARATGRPGVCLVTSGPGATNAVTGLATANIDGVPLVLVTGQVRLGLIGTDAFQEADTQGIVRGVSKHSFLVRSADEIPETVAEAFYIATHGKPGPVVIDVPSDCQQALTAASYPTRVKFRAYRPERRASAAQVARLAHMLGAARKPVLFAGGGVIAGGAAPALSALAHRLKAPVATTLMGLGAFDESDDLSLGMAGLHGSPVANRAIAEADLLVGLGVRFSDRVTGPAATFAPKAKIVHVDVDPACIGKNVRADLGLVADVKDVLERALAKVPRATREPWTRDLRPSVRPAPAQNRRLVVPHDLMAALDRTMSGDEIVVTDVGQNQLWAAQLLKHRHPRHFITSGGMGTMGFGIPAAVGAAIGRPDRKILAICGDGGAQMTAEELAVAAEQKLPIVFIIVNNGCLGLVRQWQESFYGKRYSAVFLGENPDFVKLAEAYGLEAWRVRDPARLDATLRRARAAKGPVLVDVAVAPDANAYMRPTGDRREAT